MYRREDIDRVRAATNLIDLVGSVTTVKKQGRTFMAVCPFHQEKSPSLSLDPARGLYHCFGCGKGGDVYTFVEETQGLDFNEAVELLARQAGIQIEADPGAARRRGEHDELVEAMRRAVVFYQSRLKNGADAGPARAYLRSRGIDGDTVDQYQIGYAPEEDTWDALVRELRSAGFKDRVIEAAGLARRGRGGKIYDVFRSRILFPIHDLRGDPVGFGGRAIETATPKYLNSPDSRLYQKSQLLYSLHRAKGAIARSGQAVIVEGYFDVIACHLAGVETAVATCGTALGEGHFDLLRRFAEKIVMAFDSDVAGAGAALKGGRLDTPVRLDLDLRVAEMPDGMDPADLVQEGRSPELAKAIENSRPMLQFRLEKEVGVFDLTEPEARARAIHRVAPLLARVEDEVARTEYVRFAARLIGVESADVVRALGRVNRSGPTGRDGGQIAPASRFEVELMRVILSNPPELAEVELRPEWFLATSLREAIPALAERKATAPPGEPLDFGGLEQASDLSRLALDPAPLPKVPMELVRRAQSKTIEIEIDEVEKELARADPDSQTYSELLRSLIALQAERRNWES
ncbi:MAG TPA: DNA primase [Acidimicrobiia bacterium]|nr:DNA primase [Acidimicrobiia bacterium]